MSLQKTEINAIVRQVLARLETEGVAAPGGSSGHGVFGTIDEAVEAARKAFEAFGLTSLDTRKRMIANIRRRTTEVVQKLAEDAVAETGLGRVQDKISKNLLVINKTPGPEILEPRAFTGDNGLTLNEWAPYGTLGVITPCTNPTETIINNGNVEVPPVPAEGEGAEAEAAPPAAPWLPCGTVAPGRASTPRPWKGGPAWTACRFPGGPLGVRTRTGA